MPLLCVFIYLKKSCILHMVEFQGSAKNFDVFMTKSNIKNHTSKFIINFSIIIICNCLNTIKQYVTAL